MNKFFSILLLTALIVSSKVFSDDGNDRKSLITVEKKPIMNLDTNLFNVFPEKTRKTKVGLVLSGGGSRGLSQIGVLKVFEKYGIEPDIIAGTSMGGLIGGLYSSGYTADEIEKIVLTTSWDNVLELSEKSRRVNLFLDQKRIEDRSLLTFSLNAMKPTLPSSLSYGQQILDLINKYTFNAKFKPRNSFSDLRYDFSAVATNIDNGDMVVLNSGNLAEALKASMTMPLIYEPTIVNGDKLVDGGLIANIPVDVARDMGANIVIVVNSTSPLKEATELFNPLSTADQILSISMDKLNQVQLGNADIVIRPELGDHSSTNFSNPENLIRKGEEEAELMIQNILEIINSDENIRSTYFNDFITNPSIRIHSSISDFEVENKISEVTNIPFLRFTEIEKLLKEIIATGNYKDAYAEVSRDDASGYVDFYLTGMPILNSVEVNFHHHLLDTLIANFENDLTGKPVNRNKSFTLFKNILTNLRNKGLSLVDVTTFYLDESTGVLKIELTKGNADEIFISGNESTAGSLILRDVMFDINYSIRADEVVTSLQNIYSTNLFKQVSIFPVYKNGKVFIEIDVVEKSASNLRFAIRSDNERNFQIFLDLRDENIFNSGQEVGINFAGGLKNREYKIEFRSNRFFNTLLTYNFSAYYKFADKGSFSEMITFADNDLTVNREYTYRDIRTGLRFLLGSQLERFGIVYGLIELEKTRTNIIEGTGNPFSNQTLTKFRFGGIVDSKDRIPYPSTGTELDFYYETSQSDLGASLSFTKFFIGIEHFFSLTKRSNLNPSFRFGFADNTTPLIEQYSLGGQNSFYGMVENQLTGRQLLTASLEYRYELPVRLFFDTYIAARYDLGNVWETADAIRARDFRHGLGLEVSFDTPLGKTSFAVGRTLLIKKGLTNNSFIFGPYTFYYSLGYSL